MAGYAPAALRVIGADSERRFRLVKMKGVTFMHSIANIFTKEKTDKIQTITSLEVAEMVEKKHNELLKDIRRYVEQLGEGKIPHTDFFKESTYIDTQGREKPCFDVSKKGCEYIANKLTGVKGAVFTAKFINRFHDMEDYIKQEHNKSSENSKFLMCLQGVKFIADDMKVAESSRLFMYNGAFEEFGLPTSFLPHYEDNGSRERLSATELLKRNECGMSAPKFNQLLISAGFLEVKERKSRKGTMKPYKSLTESGRKYGVNLISDKNQKETQPYYYADTFMELFEKVT